MGAPPPLTILILILISIIAPILLVIGLCVVIIRATALSFRDRADRRRREASLDMDHEIRPDRYGPSKAVRDRDPDF